MKYLAGVLALAALAAAVPEADPVHALYAPFYGPAYYGRPYYASGYAGPLPSGYQSVHRLHKRDADADAQLLLASPFDGHFAAPYAALPAPYAALPASAHAVFNAPLVRSVVEAPAVVSHTVHAAPFAYAAAPFGYAAAPFVHAAPLQYAAAPLVHAAPLAAGHAVVGLDAHDCVTEGGCALKAALTAGLPAATYGSTSIYGRKKREAEAEADAEADATADADADADADAFYNFYGYNAYNARPYGYGNGYNTYNALPYNYAPYNYNNYAYNHAAYNPAAYNSAAYAPYSYAPYSYAPYGYAAAPVVEAAPVIEAAPLIEAAPIAAYHAAPYAYHAAPYAYDTAPYAYHAAPVVSHPVVETVAKQITYTHLGAHPIQPTTVVESQSRLVGR